MYFIIGDFQQILIYWKYLHHRYSKISRLSTPNYFPLPFHSAAARKVVESHNAYLLSEYQHIFSALFFFTETWGCDCFKHINTGNNSFINQLSRRLPIPKRIRLIKCWNISSKMTSSINQLVHSRLLSSYVSVERDSTLSAS